MSNFLKAKNFYLFIFFVSIFTLLSVIFIEYVLHEVPCKLCIYQRIPYLLSIFVCFLGYNFDKKLFILYSLVTIFIVSIFLSGYHVGIESEVFEEFSGCTANNFDLIKKEEILKKLQNSLPGCKNTSFRLFGISLATLNLIISTIIAVFCLLVLKNEKNK
jgi:disulfide bond formation protein DsbB